MNFTGCPKTKPAHFCILINAVWCIMQPWPTNNKLGPITFSVNKTHTNIKFQQEKTTQIWQRVMHNTAVMYGSVNSYIQSTGHRCSDAYHVMVPYELSYCQSQQITVQDNLSLSVSYCRKRQLLQCSWMGGLSQPVDICRKCPAHHLRSSIY